MSLARGGTSRVDEWFAHLLGGTPRSIVESPGVERGQTHGKEIPRVSRVKEGGLLLVGRMDS